MLWANINWLSDCTQTVVTLSEALIPTESFGAWGIRASCQSASTNLQVCQSLTYLTLTLVVESRQAAQQGGSDQKKKQTPPAVMLRAQVELVSNKNGRGCIVQMVCSPAWGFPEIAGRATEFSKTFSALFSAHLQILPFIRSSLPHPCHLFSPHARSLQRWAQYSRRWSRWRLYVGQPVAWTLPPLPSMYCLLWQCVARSVVSPVRSTKILGLIPIYEFDPIPEFSKLNSRIKSQDLLEELLYSMPLLLWQCLQIVRHHLHSWSSPTPPQPQTCFHIWDSILGCEAHSYKYYCCPLII